MQAIPQRRLNELLVQGLIGGLVAGIVFIVFEILAAGLLTGAFVGPLRMISAIVLGPQALAPAFSATTAVVVGLLTHFVLSAIFGAIFGLILAVWPRLADDAITLVVAAMIFGLALWLVNFQVIARLLFPWFAGVDQLVFGFIAHTFFYGLPLGLYLRSVLEPERRVA